MSKPRRTERWRKQRRHKKLAHLREAFKKSTSSQDRQAILEKAIKVAPTVPKEVFEKTFQAA